MDSRYASLILVLHPNRGRPRTLFVRRWVLWLGVLVVMGGLPVAFWAVFELGQARGEREVASLERQLAELRGKRQRLQEEREELTARVAELQERIGNLESVNTVRSGERRKLHQLTDDLQHRIGNLQEELAFYRNILDPEKAERELSVKDFQVVAADGSDGEFHYAYKLVQGVAKTEPVKAFARVAVTYFDGSGQRQISYFPEGARVRKEGQEVEFRYFQTVRGRIRLPVDARPVRMRVQVYAQEGLGELLDQAHDWENLAEGVGEEADDAA